MFRSYRHLVGCWILFIVSLTAATVQAQVVEIIDATGDVVTSGLQAQFKGVARKYASEFNRLLRNALQAQNNAVVATPASASVPHR